MLQNLQAQRSLAGHDRRIVEPVDVGQPALVGQALGFAPGFAIGLAVQDDAGAQPPAGVDLDQRREPGHNHRDRDLEQAAVIGQPERMIAGRCRHHAALPPLSIEQQQGVARTALFETAGPLQILQLAIRPGARDLGQRDRLGAGGNVDSAGDTVASGYDVFEGEHGGKLGTGNSELGTGKRRRATESNGHEKHNK